MRTRFAQFLTARGFLTRRQADQIAANLLSFREVIGAIAMSHGLLNMHQLDQILSRMHDGRRFGETAIEMGMLSSAQVDALLAIQELQEAVEVGESLMIHGAITRVRLVEELGEFLRQVDGAAPGVRHAENREVVAVGAARPKPGSAMLRLIDKRGTGDDRDRNPGTHPHRG